MYKNIESPSHSSETLSLSRGIDYFFAILSAILLYVSFSYRVVSFLIWFSYVPLYILLLNERRYSRVLLFLTLTSLIFNFFYLFWMRNYKHPAALPGGIITSTIFFIIAGSGAKLLLELIKASGFKRDFWPTLIAISFWWLFVDYLKSRGFLAFPWGISGYALYSRLYVIQSASIFGIWGIDLLILVVNSVAGYILYSFLTSKCVKKQVIRGVPIVAFLLLANFLYGVITLNDVLNNPEKKSYVAKSLRVALLQPNFDPWNPDVVRNLSLEFKLTREALEEDPELIVWSESSVPFLYDYYLKRKNRYAIMVDRFFKDIRKPVIFGTIELDGYIEGDSYIGNLYNVAVFYKNGHFESGYRKIHLVPFGEWFPYDRLFPFVDKSMKKAGVEEFTPGKDYSIFTLNDILVSPLICFEDVFGDLTRKFVLRGSQLLVNITNDAWTGSKDAEWQHFSISIFRAIENRRSLVRSANGGITAGIDPWGRIIGSLEPFKSDYLIVDVPIMDRFMITFYTRYGDILPKLALFGVFFLVIFAIFKKRVDTRIV